MIAVFLVGIFWFTHGNEFPSFHQGEEEIRASQLIRGDLDLHHPLLSPVITKFFKIVFRVPDDLQAVVQLGRTVSAFFVAGSIVCLSLAVYLLGSTAAAGLLSVLLLFQHQFFALARTMSENTSLLFGASITLLMIALLEQKATVLRCTFLGVSVAIAMSAEYIGALLIVPALIAVRRFGDWEFRGKRQLEFTTSLLFAILVVDFNAFTKLPFAALDVLQDLGSAFISVPDGFTNLIHGTCWAALWRNTTPVIWAMLGASLCILWIRRRHLKMGEILLVLVPLINYLLFSFAPTGDQYFSLVIGFTYALAAVGIAWIAELILSAREELRRWLLSLLIAVCLAACLFEFFRDYPYYAALKLG